MSAEPVRDVRRFEVVESFLRGMTYMAVLECDHALTISEATYLAAPSAMACPKCVPGEEELDDVAA